MSDTTYNPCLGCATNQGCCRHLGGLILTEDEYESIFEEHKEKLVVTRFDNFLVISLKDGGTCPYWREYGCSIYQDRPIDCRLHPFMMRHFIHGKRAEKIIFNNLNDCPQRDTLMTEAEAGALVVQFGKRIYGEDKVVVAQCERGLVTRLRNDVEAVISRVRSGMVRD